MATSDTSERWLEGLIARELVAGGYVAGQSADIQRDVVLDVAQLLAFLRVSQPRAVEVLKLDDDGMPRTQFLLRLHGEIAKRGVVDVLRKGIGFGPVARLDLYRMLPTPGNDAAAHAFGQNIFSVTRQVRYSADERKRSLDLVVFINGLPVLTFELKNSLTKQTVADAVVQYQTDRDPAEPLFQLGRCIAHLAVDDVEVRFCTHLTGKTSWFLPFNQGWNGGAGNPPNPHGLKTDYLWKQVLAKESLANLVENYAQILVEEEEDAQGRKRKVRKQVFPRYHQLRTVRALLRRSCADGVGRRYLVQHSAGSGKSNTIAWLAHQLVELKAAGDGARPQYDSVIVITDRRALDTQIAHTIKGYDHVASIYGHSDSADELRSFLRRGKKIIVTTVQKFPFILDELSDLGDRKFALLIDEAHSSQGGKTTAKMHLALSGRSDPSDASPATDATDATEDNGESDEGNESSVEDMINALIESRRMLANASYYAFTATPKTRTLELFGERRTIGNIVQHRSPEELTYTTKQAIQEGFILDVLAHYTPVESFYHVAKTVDDDPQVDKAKALKKIRRYVESHDKAVRRKAEIMVDHFEEQVVGAKKIGGQARAMIVCNGIVRAVDYFREVSAYLAEIKSPHRAIVAFSGEIDVAGVRRTEADLNGFPSKDIPAKLRQNPYRFLIVANKFVTGFDEPLLHTMYVDKPLAGVLAVQTLSRLNRAHPQKFDTFVLDFAGNAEAVRAAFQQYHRATIQQGETDANRLHDLKAELDAHQVYAWVQVEGFVAQYLKGAERDRLDPILDACVAEYLNKLSEDEQVAFKGRAKAFVRGYGFLAAIMPYGHAQWEKLSVFLNFLIPKLPAPREDDLSKDVLDAIDMDSYRAQAQASLRMALDDTDATIEPIPSSGASGATETEVDRLSNVVREFNDLFGNIEWHDADMIRKVIVEDIPASVAQDRAYLNAQANSGQQNARLEHDKALQRVMMAMLDDQTELFKQFSDNPDFRRWLANTVFETTFRPPRPPATGAASSPDATK